MFLIACEKVLQKTYMLKTMLTSQTRTKLFNIIERISKGQEVSLKERVDLHKYAIRHPIITGSIKHAINILKEQDS